MHLYMYKYNINGPNVQHTRLYIVKCFCNMFVYIDQSGELSRSLLFIVCSHVALLYQWPRIGEGLVLINRFHLPHSLCACPGYFFQCFCRLPCLSHLFFDFCYYLGCEYSKFNCFVIFLSGTISRSYAMCAFSHCGIPYGCLYLLHPLHLNFVYSCLIGNHTIILICILQVEERNCIHE